MNIPANNEFQGTLSGTIGGTLLVIINLHAEELAKAAILAATGALVSFTVSWCLTKFSRYLKRKLSKKK